MSRQHIADHMLNLNTTFPIKHDGIGLTVVVDLNWFGKLVTSPDRSMNIVHSRSASVTFNDDREVIL